MRTFRYELFADYYQFYIQDEPADGNLGESWSDEAVDRLLAVAPGAVGVGTVRNMQVPVVVELHESEPAPDFETWDHVAECGLTVSSDRVVVAGCTDYFPEAARIDIAPGQYRVRVSYGSLDSLSADGLDGDDHYRLQLWPAELIEPRVVKARAV